MKKLNLILILALIPIVYAKAQSRVPLTNPGPQHILLQLAEEEYINDIPFNTEQIACEAMLSKMAVKDEANVNDIPFNTEALYLQCCLKKCTMKWRNEAYVDDIPFDTREFIEDIMARVKTLQSNSSDMLQ